MFVWQAHKGKVRALAFSPDGGLLATATGSSRFVSVWNPVTGELVQKIAPKSTDRVAWAVAFAPDAPLLAVGMSNSARVWDTTSWTPVATLADAKSSSSGFYELAFGLGSAPRLAASESIDVFVWEDAGRPAPESDPRKPDGTFRISKVSCLDFSPDGSLLATNILDRAELWNRVTGTNVRAILHTYSNHHGPVKFSPDGTRLAVGYRKLVSIYPVAESAGTAITCKGHTGPVWSACWSADGNTLLTASEDGTARLWDPTSGAELKRFEWGIGEIRTVAFSANGLLGAAAGKDGKVVVWDVDG